MGTPNFAVMNASKHFVVLTSWEEEYQDCPECGTCHWEYEHDLNNPIVCEDCGVEFNNEANPVVTETETKYPVDWDVDDLKQNLYSELEKLPYDIHDSNESLEGRSYPSTALADVQSSKEFGDVYCEVKVICFMTSGYYEGATLDWKVEYCDGSDWFDSADDIAFETGCNTEMNAGLAKIQTANAQTWAENKVNEMVERIEAIYAQHSEHQLKCIGVASNGEAFYEKA